MPRNKAYREAEKKIKEALRTGATKLDLSSMKLAELPESLGQLTQLQKLDVSKNHLTALPNSIGELHALIKLEIESNNISTLPSTIAELPRLKTIRLGDSGRGGNPLGQLPAWLQGLNRLQNLYASDCQLTVLPGWAS